MQDQDLQFLIKVFGPATQAAEQYDNYRNGSMLAKPHKKYLKISVSIKQQP